MASFYEAETSGFNPDRFVEDVIGTKDSAITKIKEKYWTTKQILVDKIGLPIGSSEDGPPIEVDQEFQEFERKFKNIQGSTSKMCDYLRRYHKSISETVNAEEDLGEFLKQEAGGQKEHLKEIMLATSKALQILAEERPKMLWPVDRIRHELSMFDERAIDDCSITVEATKKSHSEYRGALLWMKSIKRLDPEKNDRGMDEFRLAQQAFKKTKKRFDQLKEDLNYKVDLLASSRSQLMLDLTKEYAFSLTNFYESTCEQLEQLPDLPDARTYEIDITRLLNKTTVAADKKQKENSIQESDGMEGSSKSKFDKEEEPKDLITMEEVEIDITPIRELPQDEKEFHDLAVDQLAATFPSNEDSNTDKPSTSQLIDLSYS